MATLDHRPLRQFLAIADAGTVRAAARELNISQPPLTAAIRQLEARLGVALFERSVKGMTLTPAGEKLASEARAILARLARAEADVRTVAGRPVPLRIGFVSAALNRTLPTLIRALAAECGAPFRVAVEARRIHSQLAMVAAGLGVGLITRSTAGVLSFDGVRAIPLTDVQDRLFLELYLMAAPARLPVLAKALAGSARP